MERGKRVWREWKRTEHREQIIERTPQKHRENIKRTSVGSIVQSTAANFLPRMVCNSLAVNTPEDSECRILGNVLSQPACASNTGVLACLPNAWQASCTATASSAVMLCRPTFNWWHPKVWRYKRLFSFGKTRFCYGRWFCKINE